MALWRVLADNEKARLKIQPCFDVFIEEINITRMLVQALFSDLYVLSSI